MDEPTEQVPPANIERADRDRDGDRGFSQRRGEAEGAMGAPAVVVLDIGPKRSILPWVWGCPGAPFFCRTPR